VSTATRDAEVIIPYRQESLTKAKQSRKAKSLNPNILSPLEKQNKMRYNSTISPNGSLKKLLFT
jgi:hypothetical protein